MRSSETFDCGFQPCKGGCQYHRLMDGEETEIEDSFATRCPCMRCSARRVFNQALKGASVANKNDIKKGDRVKVAFEGTVTFKSNYENEISVRADDGREVEYLRSDHLTRVVPPAPPKGSVVKTSKGTWIRLDNDASSWYLVNREPNNMAWIQLAQRWDIVYEPGFTVLN